MNMDLRNSPEDHSLRMLNAIEPGTLLPIHRHRESSETVVMLRGKGRWNYYDDHGNLTETFVLSSDGDLRGALRPPRPVTQRREPRKRHGAAGMPGREVGAAEGGGCVTDLKKKSLIEYRGSDKNGGYYAKEEMMIQG
jgi:hypothetical protein